MALERWQEVGCGKYCLECPPTPEMSRLALFRCDEVSPEDSALSLDELAQRPDLLKLFRGPARLDMGGAGDFGPDPTGIVGGDWDIMEEDRRMLAEYSDWLPDKVFDARAPHLTPTPPSHHPTPLICPNSEGSPSGCAGQTRTCGTSTTGATRSRPRRAGSTATAARPTAQSTTLSAAWASSARGGRSAAWS